MYCGHLPHDRMTLRNREEETGERERGRGRKGGKEEGKKARQEEGRKGGEKGKEGKKISLSHITHKSPKINLKVL